MHRADSAPVKCAGCGAALTVPLAGGEAGLLQKDAQNRQPVVPQGFAVVDPALSTYIRIVRGGPREEVERCPAKNLVVNPLDLIPDAVVVTGRAVGCCGLDGMEGPNQACAACGQILGTAMTDCWTAAEVRFLPDAVTRESPA